MLYLFRLKQTSSRLRDGNWTAKNDLFCLGFFMIFEYLSVGQNMWWLFYKMANLVAIYFCWRANGADRGTDFLRRFLALYRCCVMRLWFILLLLVVFMLLAGFIGCVFSGNLTGALYGECAPGLSDKVVSLLAVRPAPSIGYFSEFLSVGHFVYWGIFGFFWATIDSCLVKIAITKPLLALPEGTESLPDLSG